MRRSIALRFKLSAPPLKRYMDAVKYLVILAALFALNSCNTLIGVTRDTKEGYRWAKQKMQKKEPIIEQSNAPVY